MDTPHVFTRDELKTAYDIFQEVSGGLFSDWIFDSDTVAEDAKLMIGVPVGGAGAGRTWQKVWVNIPSMRDDQLKVWESRKSELDADLIEDWADETTIRIGFAAKQKNNHPVQPSTDADQLKELSPEVDADTTVDTEAGEKQL